MTPEEFAQSKAKIVGRLDEAAEMQNRFLTRCVNHLQSLARDGDDAAIWLLMEWEQLREHGRSVVFEAGEWLREVRSA